MDSRTARTALSLSSDCGSFLHLKLFPVRTFHSEPWSSVSGELDFKLALNSESPQWQHSLSEAATEHCRNINTTNIS
ncbi:MAG: hypothetical protein AAFO96_29525, partial [Bacteroidota bacterium]